MHEKKCIPLPGSCQGTASGAAVASLQTFAAV